jgi:cytochrome c oxidase subunit 2
MGAMTIFKRLTGLAGAIAAGTAAVAGKAHAAAGAPVDWQIGFQDAATPVMYQVAWFHNYLLLPIIAAVAGFVMLLLAVCMVRFRKGAKPTPSKTSHHTFLEVAWTVVPVLTLVVIAIPSFRLLYFQQDYLYRVEAPDLTVKAIGVQWYWTYEYPDNGGFGFDSFLVPENDLQPGQPRLLTVDAEVVVPVGKLVRMIVTADPQGVIHSWAIPAFGVKIDAVPGRLNETWFKVERAGLYHGQCSELCGKDHAFMPITVRAVSQEEFDAWAETARTAGVEQANKMFALKTNAPAAAGGRAAALKGSSGD